MTTIKLALFIFSLSAWAQDPYPYEVRKAKIQEFDKQYQNIENQIKNILNENALNASQEIQAQKYDLEKMLAESFDDFNDVFIKAKLLRKVKQLDVQEFEELKKSVVPIWVAYGFLNKEPELYEQVIEKFYKAYDKALKDISDIRCNLIILSKAQLLKYECIISDLYCYTSQVSWHTLKLVDTLYGEFLKFKNQYESDDLIWQSSLTEQEIESRQVFVQNFEQDYKKFAIQILIVTDLLDFKKGWHDIAELQQSVVDVVKKPQDDALMLITLFKRLTSLRIQLLEVALTQKVYEIPANVSSNHEATAEWFSLFDKQTRDLKNALQQVKTDLALLTPQLMQQAGGFSLSLGMFEMLQCLGVDCSSRYRELLETLLEIERFQLDF
jgi:hypothetical protein